MPDQDQPFVSVRPKKEVEELLNEVGEYTIDDRSKFFGMTFEQGIEHVINWLTDPNWEHPMTD